jgi:hypothetical protein
VYPDGVVPSQPSRPQLALAQRVAADVLAAIERPIAVHGFAYTQFACCEAPKHALAWAVAEAGVAGTVWAALAERGAIRPCGSTLARRFACPVCFRHWWQDQRHGRRHHGGCPVCRGAGLLEAPPTCVACVALAADPDGICAAEARVVDLARALAPWGAREPSRVIWRVRDREPSRTAAPVPLRLAAAGASVSTRRPGMQAASIGSDAARRAAWRRAIDEDARVQPRAGKGVWPLGASFAALPDPFAALDALDELGYTLEDLTDDAAVLCAPPAELDGPSFGELVELHDRDGTRPGAWPR